MAKPYEDYEDDDNEQGDEDEDIGALGSILSWDEDEEGGVGGTSPSGGESSGLPDLVSFNLKDGALNALQQLQAAGDAPNLNLPLPTPINFAQQQITSLSSSSHAALPQHRQEEQKGGTRTQQPLAAAPPAQQNAVATQQQLQQQLQQQHQIHQQYQIQAQQQQQQQASQAPQTAPAQPQPPSTAQQQAQQVQVAQQQAQAAQQAAQQGAFQLFQQGALMAQQNQNSKQQQQPLVPAIMMPGVPQQGQDVQNQAAQFAFAADPASFLRQLQVAQLQQQFNAVQQGRAMTPQVVVPSNQAPQAMAQHMHFQGQVAPVAPTQPPAQQAPPPKRARAKKPPPSLSAPQSSTLAASKAPVVSASDTDGESRIVAGGSKTSKKSGSSSLVDSFSFSDSKLSDIDLSNMSPAEKAKANRDRNREHARNTRLRKKVYLEKLKATVDELCRERDTLVSERAGAANILVEMYNTRTEVLMSFFALRSANEKRRELWSSILDESSFTCVMPVTPYRSFPASEVQVSKCQRTVLGIDGMMSDTSSLHVLLNSLVDRSRFPNATIVFRYTLVTEEAVVAGNQMMARWVMSTLNASQCGARTEVAKQGMLCCKFNSANKIVGLELTFDVMALMLQLKQAAGSDTFSVIPNTVQTCQRSFDKPMVMTLAEEPYTIVQVNKLWEDMTGYSAEEVVGKTSCRILEGEETKPAAVEGLLNEVRFKRPASAMIVRYTKSREKFRDFFLAYPLSTDSRITHYLFLSSHVDSGQALLDPSQQSNQGLSQSQGTASQLPPPVPAKTQQTFYGMPNVPGAAAAHAQPIFHLPAVMSNPLASTQPQAAMLTSATSLVGGPSSFQVGGLKRPLAGNENLGQPAKQSKTSSTGTGSTERPN